MTEIICPHCKNPIYDDDALLCHFCGSTLNRKSSGGVMGKMRSGGIKWIFITLALIVLAAFLLTMF